MRYVWIVLLALSLSTVVYGQKSAAVRQLEQQRKEALADIEETNKLLQETAQTAKTSLNRLNLLSKQILSRKKVISLLNQELDEIEKDILNIQGQLRTLKRELGDKQTNYGKSMRGLYKRHSSQDKLLFILSAESFSQSMRRMRYLREYADWQKRQANDIVEKQAEISRKQAEMEKTRAEKRVLLGTRQEESKKLESEEASQKEEVQLLNKCSPWRSCWPRPPGRCRSALRSSRRTCRRCRASSGCPSARPTWSRRGSSSRSRRTADALR